MEQFYFENIYPVLPGVGEVSYRSSQDNRDSPQCILQKQSIWLFSSTNLCMREHLRLGDSQDILSPRLFAQRIVGAMRLTIELALVSDKVIITQALTAMSLLTYGRESIELAPEFFAKVVYHAYSIGLHQPSDDEGNTKAATLFAYVWSVDRFHAAMQGKPIFMHEVDMARGTWEFSLNQRPGFRVFVRIAMLLDKVIELYRPNSSGLEISDDAFHDFEDILDDCAAL